MADLTEDEKRTGLYKELSPEVVKAMRRHNSSVKEGLTALAQIMADAIAQTYDPASHLVFVRLILDDGVRYRLNPDRKHLI